MQPNRQISVLLVDDEEDFLHKLARRLEVRGFKTETALNGIDAVKLLKDKSFDVVILDLTMPGIDGIETLRRMKRENPDMQIMILTGHATVEKSVEAMKEGALDFLEKPVDINLLVDKMTRAWEKTEKAKIEQRMAHTEKLASLGTLAAGVAHELNNPLTIILGMTDLMLEKVSEESEEFELLKTIERQGTNAKRIVEKLVRFARDTELTEQDFDINESLIEVLSMVRKTMSLSKIEIISDMDVTIPKIKGNYGELQQVFLNIITNAFHEMKHGGLLTVRTSNLYEGRGVEIRFTDTGTGIEKKYRNRVFDPFFTTKKVGEGTGLGLSVSYGIIERHKGTIVFETKTIEESETPGTTFIITLPGFISQMADDGKIEREMGEKTDD